MRMGRGDIGFLEEDLVLAHREDAGLMVTVESSPWGRKWR